MIVVTKTSDEARETKYLYTHSTAPLGPPNVLRCMKSHHIPRTGDWAPTGMVTNPARGQRGSEKLFFALCPFVPGTLISRARFARLVLREPAHSPRLTGWIWCVYHLFLVEAAATHRDHLVVSRSTKYLPTVGILCTVPGNNDKTSILCC